MWAPNRYRSLGAFLLDHENGGFSCINRGWARVRVRL